MWYKTTLANAPLWLWGALLGTLLLFGLFVKSQRLVTQPIQSPSQPTAIRTRTTSPVVEEIPDRTSLEYKIRHRKASEEERFMISGMEIRIGETADSVFQKSPESLAVKQVQDKEYGLVVEHNYGKYSILLARNVPTGGADGSWFIVYDVYSSDYTP